VRPRPKLGTAPYGHFLGCSIGGWGGLCGAEWRFSPNWSVFAEYDYFGFTDKMVSFPNSNNIGTVHQNVQVGLIGVNFRFSGGMY